jgi:biopolymer transport protein ExbD
LEPLRSDSPQGARAAPLVVLIDRAGRIRLNGEPLDDTTLAGRIAEILADGPRRIQIKADAALDALRLVALLEQLRGAGAEEIDLLTLARGG